MSEILPELRYTRTHEWVRQTEDGLFEVGLTDHAQEQLGDMVFVELPDVGSALGAGDECAVVESVKAASDLYCPMNGEIVEVNESLQDAPEQVNSGPYAEGWLFKLKADDDEEWNDLLEAESYQEIVDSE